MQITVEKVISADDVLNRLFTFIEVSDLSLPAYELTACDVVPGVTKRPQKSD